MFHLDQTRAPLLEKLRECATRSHAAFYAPGHKRGQGISPNLADLLGQSIFQADLPELPELDNLFAPEGVIQSAQALAAEAFGAEHTFFLVNGSTSGIEAALLAVCRPGDKIILPRNVHRSVISALILTGAMPVFVPPEYDPLWGLAHSITPKGVADALTAHPDAKAVMMVYPTYYGACGDIAAIAHLTHAQNLPLLVDEAHAAHFAFHPDLPTSALAGGADLTVQSIHKTLGSMTQSSMLHLQGERIDGDRLHQALQLVQSTSPSYLLLASLDAARQQMALQGQALMTRTLQLADQARNAINQIPGLTVLSPQEAGKTPGFTALDRTRLTVDVSGLGLTGYAADEILHTQFGVTAELPTLQHLTFIVSLGNTQQDIDALVHGFEQLAREQGVANREHPRQKRQRTENSQWVNHYRTVLSPRDAFFAETEVIPIEEAGDRICAELVCPYPPGIPLLIPGEPIQQATLDYLQQVLEANGVVTGCADPDLKTLKVVTRL